MSSSCSPRTILEDLPNELLLLICRYLSSTDVLFSFYGLNCRLSQTISGYFRHVVIAQTPYMQFKSICTSILPEIGSNIYSLVISNQWKGVLSKIFLSYFGERMSLTFPNLKYLIFISFNANSLKLFLDSLQNLPELHEIVLCYQYEVAISPCESQILLHRIFSANNNRLNSILFDDESIVFSLDDKSSDILYFNIQKLSIDLKTVNDLHRLLTVLPQLISINVTINEESIELDKLNKYIPIDSLKQFQLQSFGPSWNLDELMSVLKRLPNVEELSIAIESLDDARLIDGENFFSLVSSLSLKKFNYFVRFYDSSPSIDPIKVRFTWQKFPQEFVCINSDDEKTLVLYTLPFAFSYLILPSSLAKNEVFIESYAPQVKMLTLYDVSAHMVDTFSVIKKCHRIKRLNLRTDENIVAKVSKEICLCKLPYLTKIMALRGLAISMEYFQSLLEVSPNLYHLEVNYEFLQPLFDNEYPCLLFGHRITHLYMTVPLLMSIESVTYSISRLPSIFPSLKHFYFNLEKGYQSSESLILAVLKYLSQWNFLVSFGVVDIVMTKEILSKDIQQWVLENSTLYKHKSFFVDYVDNIFRLWL